MKIWKIAALAGYVAGIAVALKYAKKTPAQIKADEKSGKNMCSILWENMVSIHKSIFADAKDAAWNETTQGYVQKAKLKIENLADDFRKEAIAKLEELKLQGKDWAAKAQVEIQRIYDHRMEYLSQVKDLSRDLGVKLRTELQDAFQWVKGQVAGK